MRNELVRKLDMAQLVQAVRTYLTVTAPDVFGRNKLSLTFHARKNGEDLELWAELRRTTQLREDPDD